MSDLSFKQRVIKLQTIVRGGMRSAGERMIVLDGLEKLKQEYVRMEADHEAMNKVRALVAKVSGTSDA